MARGGGGVLGLIIFAGYVLLASQNPYPIKLVYSVANRRTHLIHFWGSHLSHFLFVYLPYTAF